MVPEIEVADDRGAPTSMHRGKIRAATFDDTHTVHTRRPHK